MTRIVASNRLSITKRSLLFNGTSDVLTLPLIGNPANITVFCRFKLAAGETAADLAYKYSGASSRSWVLGFASVTSLRWMTSNTGAAGGTQEVIATVSTIANSTGWHTAAGTYDGANLVAYLDGAQAGSPVAQTGAIFSSSTTPKLGLGGRNGAYNGSIDDFMIYNRALTSGEISTLHSGKAVTSGLLVAYPMNEGSGTKITDITSNHNDGVLTGGTWQTDVAAKSWGRYPLDANRTSASARGTA